MMYTMPKNLLSICVNFTLATQPLLHEKFGRFSCKFYSFRNFCEQLFDCIRAWCFPAFYCEVESYPKVYPQSVYFCAISAGHFSARWRKVGVRFSFSALVVRSG